MQLYSWHFTGLETLDMVHSKLITVLVSILFFQSFDLILKSYN